MAEFKKLSEVEQIETASDNATVLVEEGGEIKRVAKTEVGGGAGGMVITLTEENTTVYGNNIICTENYDAMYEHLQKGGVVWIEGTAIFNSVMGTSYLYNTGMVLSAMLMPEEGLGAMGWIIEGPTMIVFPNGSYHSV